MSKVKDPLIEDEPFCAIGIDIFHIEGREIPKSYLHKDHNKLFKEVLVPSCNEPEETDKIKWVLRKGATSSEGATLSFSVGEGEVLGRYDEGWKVNGRFEPRCGMWTHDLCVYDAYVEWAKLMLKGRLK